MLYVKILQVIQRTCCRIISRNSVSVLKDTQNAFLTLTQCFSKASCGLSSTNVTKVMESSVLPTHDKADEGTLSKKAKRRLEWQRKSKEARWMKKAEKQRKMDEKNDQNIVPSHYLQEAEYYFENGLRKVYPYFYKYSTHAKGRWVGQKLVDLFQEEFRNAPPGFFERAVKLGRLMVNSKPVTEDYVVKHNDFVENLTHRHEQPVTMEPITVVADDEDVIAVNKPPSIPMHPCGRYRHNSLVYILAKERGLTNLRPFYRLDRLTSGLVIFSKSSAKNRVFQNLVRQRKLHKEYVCRVQGCFPEEEIICKEPLDTLSHKLGMYKVAASGKEAKTTFQRLSTNGTTSVVKCIPHTGRTHQIRVHLQYMGYPIVNDSLYNTEVWGTERGKGGNYGKSEEELIEAIFREHSRANHLLDEEGTIDSLTEPSETGSSIPQNNERPAKKQKLDPACDASASSAPENADPTGQSGSHTDVPDTNVKKVNASPLSGNGEPFPHNGRELTRGTMESSESKLTHDNGSKLHTITKETKTSDMDQNSGAGVPQPEFDPEKLTTDEHCTECKSKYKDPDPKQLVIYLHALRYKGPDWMYETPLPDWAREDWQDT